MSGKFVNFVIGAGYKDDPPRDEKGIPLRRRTTPVHLAYRLWSGDNRRRVEVIHKLFRIYDCYDVNFVDERGLTHLHVACEFGLADVVGQFRKPDCLSMETGDSPLIVACSRGHPSVVEGLLKNEANPNLANFQTGRTPLHVLCDTPVRDDHNMMIKMAYILLRNSCSRVVIDARDSRGDTALHLAVKNNARGMIELLLREGANPNSVNAAGSTPLHVACERTEDASTLEDAASLTELIIVQVNARKELTLALDAKNGRDKTPLELAVANLKPREVNALLTDEAALQGFVYPRTLWLPKGAGRSDAEWDLYMVAATLACVEILMKSGFQLTEDHKGAIKKFFRDGELFKKTELWLDNTWGEDEDFIRALKRMTFKAGVSVYKVLHIRWQDAMVQFSYADFWRFEGSREMSRELDVKRQKTLAWLLFFAEKKSRNASPSYSRSQKFHRLYSCPRTLEFGTNLYVRVFMLFISTFL
ncbi:unnamed protein product [Trichogramma brassicae]|uniref:Uncharacterized protein n=1 Tax=Trichogramma brassicae TaxID=86971 RepID=A0A6H5I9I9_9HYME|nr:unnamed protein product [Trichogramma brassicae]